MPRRLKLSPLQRDIMMMLEEAGAETVGTVIATLKLSDRSEFDWQVNGLVTLGLIRKECYGRPALVVDKSPYRSKCL